MFRKKIPFGRIIPPFFFESSESDCVFNYLHDSNSIFRVGGIKSENVFGRTVKVCYRDEKYSVEVQVPSLFQDNTASWVRIVTGVDKDVTESMPTAKEEDTASGKPIAEARPRQKPTLDYCDMINQFL